MMESKSHNVPWTLGNKWLNAHLLADTLTAKISHIYHKGNCITDKLVSNATSPGTNSWHFNAPDYINNILYTDKVPLPYYRFRNL